MEKTSTFLKTKKTLTKFSPSKRVICNLLNYSKSLTICNTQLGNIVFVNN